MGLTESLLHLFTSIIGSTGYIGVFLLMIAESMVLPVPSEAVMPFAGYLWFQGTFSLPLIIIASTLGSIVGSLISYWIGAKGGRLFVSKFGKYLLLNEHHLDKTEAFFSRFGEKTIFISRFIPVVRHLISIPAGTGKMKLPKFIIYTAIGSALWNTALTYCGYLLGKNWNMIRTFGEILDIIIVLAIIAVIIYFIRKRKQQKNNLKIA